MTTNAPQPYKDFAEKTAETVEGDVMKTEEAVKAFIDREMAAYADGLKALKKDVEKLANEGLVKTHKIFVTSESFIKEYWGIVLIVFASGISVGLTIAQYFLH